MTREEILYCMKANSVLHSEICEECPFYGDTSYCFEDALDEVIKELEQEPCIQEKQANADKMDAEYIDGFKAGYSQAKFDLEQEPCEDAISRQAAIFLADELKQDVPDDERLADMAMAHNEGILDYQTQLSLLPSITPQEPCDVPDINVGDTISRQAVLDALEWKWAGKAAFDAIKELPPVNPQPKIGYWIDEFGGCECSECGCLEGGYSDYCPNCGAKMLEPQESEDKE